MTDVLTKTLPVLAAILLGALCRKRGFLDEGKTQTLKDTAINVTLPFVLLSAFGSTEFTLSNLLIPSISFLSCIVALLLGLAMFRILRMEGQVMPYLTSGFEAGMLGYALFAILRGGDGLSAFALIDLGQVVFVFTVYRIMVSGKRDVKEIVSNIIGTPVIWGMAAGILLSITGLYSLLGDYLESMASFISAPTGCIILLCIGSDLVSQSVHPRKAIAPVLLRLGILAVVFFLICGLDSMIHSGIDREALLLMFILPSPFVLPIFATVAEERSDIASALSIQTVLTLVLFAVMVITH